MARERTIPGPNWTVAFNVRSIESRNEATEAA